MPIPLAAFVHAVIARVRADAARGDDRLALALAVSFALHAGALAAMLAPQPIGQGGRGAPGIVVRMVQGPPESAPSRTAPVEPAPIRTTPPRRAAATARSATAPAAVSAAPTPALSVAPVATGPVPNDASVIDEAAAGAIYLTSSQVDRRAAPSEEPDLEPPAEAAFASGYLVLRILVNEAGVVDAIETLVSDPEGLFDATAIRAFRDVRYRPAEKDGRPVKSEMIVEVKFDPPLPVPGQPLVLTPQR